ncbi:MAG: ABC transporter ATP-binding protein [Synechococcales bacterium]|nr:ABC transporter ATP-binding protein [Synechococcales bacterium]
MQAYFSKFFYILAGRKRQLVLLTALALFSSALEAFGIGLVGPFITIATAANQDPWLTQAVGGFLQALGLGGASAEEMKIRSILVLGLGLVLAFYIKTFIGFCVQRSILNFGFGQGRILSARLMNAYSHAPYTYHLEHSSAELTQNMLTETDNFVQQCLLPLLFSTAHSFIILAVACLLVATNVLAVVVIAGVFLVSLLIFQRFKHMVGHWGKERSEAYEEAIRVINHSVGGLKEIRVIGCETYFQKQADDQLKRHATATASYWAFTNVPRYMMEALLITFLVLFTYIFLSIDGGKSGNLNSVLGIFALASIRLLPSVNLVINGFNGVRYSSFMVDKLYLCLKELEMIPAARNFSVEQLPPLSSWKSLHEKPAMPFQQEIQIDRLGYRYPSAKEAALREISLRLKKGESIGLIGRSGAGKTTLVDVLLGLLTPDKGDIRVDGVSVYPELRTWQQLIGYVPQTIFLTEDTLEHNIAFGVPDHLIDPQRLHQAIVTAQLSELVDRLPQGIHTMLGERGMRLSGGQRQRVGIARAIYHDREILVLDEATSALDNETESLVSDAVKALGGIKTMIIIAHRLTTLEHCDRIYVLEQGNIVETGSYQDIVVNGKRKPVER